MDEKKRRVKMNLTIRKDVKEAHRRMCDDEGISQSRSVERLIVNNLKQKK